VMVVSVRSMPMEPRSSMWMAGAWGWSIGLCSVHSTFKRNASLGRREVCENGGR
jgi:hypothetical protein